MSTTNPLPSSFDTVQNTETKADLWGLDLLASKTANTKIVHATVTQYDGSEPCDWAGYVTDRLQAEYPGADIDVTYGSRLAAFADGKPLADFRTLHQSWWDELCNDANDPHWTR